jgi:multidrug efflux pump subunit AcrA (membrane-fusion protein)
VSGQGLADYDKKALERLNDQLSEATLALQSARLSLQAARLATSDADKLRIENAQNEYDNAKILYEAGAIAKKEVDTAFEALQRAEIQIEEQNKNMQNQISLLQVSVAQSELRISQLNKEIASFSPTEIAMQGGTLIATFVKKGDVVPTGMRLFEIADVSLNNLVIKVNVPENEARNLGIGQEVEIRVNAIGQEVFAGHVSKISPLASIKQVGNSMETVLTLEIICEDAPLKAGYTVDATIITKTVADTVVVPLMSTLRENDGHNYIFIMRDDFSVEKRQIELGEYSGIYVQATNVAEDEITILNPSAQLQEEDIFVNPVHFF